MSAKPFGLAVKALVKDAQGRCLLIRRSQESKHFRGQWDLPGGKVDSGEDFTSALYREAGEEIGLKVSITGVAGAAEYEMPAVRVVLLFLEARLESEQVTLSNEHDAYLWVPLAELPQMNLSDQLRPFLEKYVKANERKIAD